MVQGRAAGNGNFDIDAITRLVNADANASSLINQPFIDPVADAFAADVDDMVDELRFNPSSNLAEEAQQIMNSPLAAKLGAGVMADLRAAVQLQEEKAENGADAFMRGNDAWNEQKAKTEKEREAQAKAADFADDVQNGSQLSTKPDQYGLSEQNYADLSGELKSRDGQERMMSFLRMMYPNLTDAQLKQKMDDAKIVAAVRSGSATDEEKAAYDGMSTERREDASETLRGYQEWKGQGFNSDFSAQRTAGAATASPPLTMNETVEAGTDAVKSQESLTSLVEPTAPITPVVARDEKLATNAPDLQSAFAVAASPAAPPPPPNRVAELQLAAARSPAADQAMGI